MILALFEVRLPMGEGLELGEGGQQAFGWTADNQGQGQYPSLILDSISVTVSHVQLEVVLLRFHKVASLGLLGLYLGLG